MKILKNIMGLTLMIASTAAVIVSGTILVLTFKHNDLYKFLWMGVGSAWVSACLIAATYTFLQEHCE